MKNKDILSLLYRFSAPAAVVVLGAVLVINPDFVSVLLSRLVAWAISLVGIGFLVAAIFGRNNQIRRLLCWLACSGIGSWLIASPLVPAAFAGRILGLLLAVRGIRDLTISQYRGGKALSIVLSVSGAVLILLPMTASRLVFSAFGVLIVLVGIGMFLERRKELRYLEGFQDDIIDAL